jgi:hypothetical protein
VASGFRLWLVVAVITVLAVMLALMVVQVK